MRTILSFVSIFAWAAIALISVESLAISDEQVNTDAFVVEGRGFRGDQKKPSSRSLTVFQGAKAYDRTPGSAEIAVYDFQGRTVGLVDVKRSVRTEIPFQDVLWAQAEINKFATEKGGVVGFLANPTFVRTWAPDKSTATITLSSPMLTYKAEGKQTTSNIAERFAEFADWSARVSNLVNRSPYPAQARLELNLELKKYDLLVSRVTRSGGPRALKLGTVCCERTYRTELNESERDLIRVGEKSLKEFKQLSVSEYLGVEKSSKLASKK